jgi:hypothetical protein
MTYLDLAKYSHFSNPKVLAKIRRAIASAMAGGECVCVRLHEAKGLTDAARTEITRDWPPTKVRFSGVHPTLSNVPVQKERRTRRQL